MALESYTTSTLGNRSPTQDLDSDLFRHPYIMKLKNKFSFGTPQDRPLLLMINAALQLLRRELL